MKKILLLLSVTYCATVNAQNTFPASGNVGIGTLSPSTELEIKGTIFADTILFPDGTKQATAFPSNPKFLKVGDSSMTITGKSIIRDDGELRIQTADTIHGQTSACKECPPYDTTIIVSSNDFNTIINGGNNGKVGIGTFFPSEKLSVAGTIQSTIGGFKFPDGSIQTIAGIQQNSSAAFSSLAISNLSGTGDRIIAADASGNLKISSFMPLAASWEIQGNTIASGDYIGTNNTADLVFKTNVILDQANSERMRITSTGKVGVGTNNPQSMLHLFGLDVANCPVGIRLQYQFNGPPVNGCSISSRWDIKNSGSGTLDFSTPTVGIPIMTMHPSGVNINGTIKTTGKVLASAYASNSPLIFEAPVGTERARIDDLTGNVGIGTTTPQCQLDVNPPSGTNGICVNTSPLSGGFGFLSKVNSNTADAIVVSNTSTGSQNFIVKGDGKTGIGTGTPSQQLHIAGISPAIKFEDNVIESQTTELTDFTISANNGSGRLISNQSVTIFINGDANDNNRFFRVVDNADHFSGFEKTLFNIEENGNASLYGELHACEVVVEVLNGCDFVLEENYNLLPLKIRKEKVLLQKHLLNIKPAAEMEEKGADLGNTTMGILQNVEEHELFLYNHDERIELLEKENKEMKKLITEMKTKIENLKK